MKNGHSTRQNSSDDSLLGLLLHLLFAICCGNAAQCEQGSEFFCAWGVYPHGHASGVLSLCAYFHMYDFVSFNSVGH